MPFGIGHPHLHIKPNLYVCRRVQGSQIFKQNWIILIRSRVFVFLPIWVSSALGVGQVDRWCPGWSTIVYMSSGMFRGKESSNRIKLSWLVQELLNFGDLGSLQLWGWVNEDGGWLGVPPTHMHVHTHMHAHACMVNMIISCKWQPPLGESLGIPCDVICMHACMCTCVGGTLSPPSTKIHPPPTPWGDPQNQSKFHSTWTNRDISILFEDLKSVEKSPHMGGCMVWWVGGWVGWWVGSGQITKNLKIVDWIKIIQFCLKIYDL